MKGISADGTVVEYGVVAMIGAIAASMSGSIFSSDAWNNVTFIAGEIKNPKRNIGLSLFFGTLIVTILYVSANLMYLYVLPLSGVDSVADPEGQIVAGQPPTSPIVSDLDLVLALLY